MIIVDLKNLLDSIKARRYQQELLTIKCVFAIRKFRNRAIFLRWQARAQVVISFKISNEEGEWSASD